MSIACCKHCWASRPRAIAITRSSPTRMAGASPSAIGRRPCAPCATAAAHRKRCARWQAMPNGSVQPAAQAGDKGEVIGIVGRHEAVAQREIDDHEIDVELVVLAVA